jgi:ADP-heptose:LPS heptosyltransferase
MMLKLNMGSGRDYRHGWINVDKYPNSKPDIVWDLEDFPWPFSESSVDYVLFNHSLEHIAGTSELFIGLVKELYRVCKDGATVEINVPSPDHDDYYGDPTHVRPVKPQIFDPFDLLKNEIWGMKGLPGTPLATYERVDFFLSQSKINLSPVWSDKFEDGKNISGELRSGINQLRNVVETFSIQLTARKPFRPGIALRSHDVLVVSRMGGLGDVLMAIQALAFAKSLAPDLHVTFVTRPAYRELISFLGIVNDCFSTIEEALQNVFKMGFQRDKIIYRDWNGVKFGVSRFHEVESFLTDLGLSVDQEEVAEVLFSMRQRVRKDIFSATNIGFEKVSSSHILIHPGQTDPNRTLSTDLWRGIAQALSGAGYSLSLIGSNDSWDKRGALELDGLVNCNYLGKLSLVETLALMSRCSLLVSNDSGPIQLASLVGLPVVGIYSVVPPSNRLPIVGPADFPVVGIDLSCELGNCYKDISQDKVIQNFCERNKISPKDTPSIFSKWCLNDSMYRCMEDSRVVSRVVQEVGTIVRKEAAA